MVGGSVMNELNDTSTGGLDERYHFWSIALCWCNDWVCGVKRVKWAELGEEVKAMVEVDEIL